MAPGFIPKYTTDYPLGELTQEQFLVIAYEAVFILGWQNAYLSNRGLIAYPANDPFPPDTEVTIRIADGVARLQISSTGTGTMDISPFLSVVNELKSANTQEALAAKYEMLLPRLTPDAADILKPPAPAAKEQPAHFLSVFKPAGAYSITPILLNINLLIFIIMASGGVNILEPDGASLLKWGANFRPMTLDGQWWRLLTNCFLHIGILHLLMNMFALVFIGLLLEPHLGRLRFLAAYLLTGITASIVSLWWHELSISAGASGAIFGMYGVFLAMLTTDFIEKRMRKVQLTSIAIFVVYNLVGGLKGNTDNAAHVGGLVSGLVIGYLFIPGLKRRRLTD